MHYDGLSDIYSHRPAVLRLLHEISDEHNGPGEAFVIANVLFLRRVGEPEFRDRVRRSSHGHHPGRFYLHGYRQFSGTARLSYLRPNGDPQKAIAQFARIQRLQCWIVHECPESHTSHQVAN